MSVSERRRQSDDERSRRTRERILQAAVECLIDDGYAAASIGAIQARAGVSRGALQHQYSSKAELLVDAVRRLARQQSDELQRRATRPTRKHWLDALWSAFDSALFGAVLELWIAARTDDELRRVVLVHQRQLRNEMRDVAMAYLPGEPRPGFDTAFDMTLTYYRGLALTAVLSRRQVARLKRDWKEAASRLLV